MFDQQLDQQTASELLLYCLGMGTDKVGAARLEQLSVSDWDDVIRQSLRYGVAPLFYQRLSTLSPGKTIPAGGKRRLRETYLRSAARNVRLYHELSKVLRTFQNDGIPVIVLKGAHLAEVVYGNIALRPMGDVDLLVRRTDLSRVVERLLEMSYSPSRRFWIEAECATSQHLAPFTKPGAASLEIHWTITHPTGPFKIDIDGLWRRARPAVIAGVEVLVLSPEDLLLHLCLHTSFQHRFAIGLRPFCDISETLRHYQNEMDWEQVRLRIGQWDASKPVYLTLYLARELLGVIVPDEVLDTLKPDGFDLQVVAWIREQIFTDRGNTPPPSPNLARIWGANRLQDKVATFLRFAFPSPEVMAKMYPVSPFSKQIYLYYPIRLKDLFLRYGRAAWWLLRRNEEMMTLAERENRGNALVDWLASV